MDRYRGYAWKKGKREHVLIAERVLGRKLTGTERVHHVNGNRKDNRHENLVICEDQAFHALLHARAKAYAATGSPTARKCYICQSWDAVDALRLYKRKAKRDNRPVAVHLRCKREAQMRWSRSHGSAKEAKP